MSAKIKIEPYLSSPIFAFVVGLFLGGFGLLAMRVAADDTLFYVLTWILTICGPLCRSVWIHGNVGG